MNKFFDCVLFLTWSNWETEMRSNRFHFATRFAKTLPVVFVQVGKSPKQFYKLEDHNIFILNIEKIDIILINRKLNILQLKCPLVWVYNPNFTTILDKIYSPIKVFHATEDYFSEDFNKNPEIQVSVKKILKQIDLAVCVSEGVKEHLTSHAPPTIKTLVLTNGCDFEFWQPSFLHKRTNIVLYQGGITNKIDFQLLLQTMKKLKDWRFYICGEASTKSSAWLEILNQKNVTYFKQVSPEKVRDLALNSKVGIIPFVQNDWIVKRSLPLKAFEYLAAGLAVVSTPIEGLSNLTENIDFANNLETFAAKIDFYSQDSIWEQDYQERLKAAQKQDYTNKFRRLEKVILEFVNSTKNNAVEFRSRKNILIVLNAASDKVSKSKTRFESILASSQHSIHFSNTDCSGKNKIDLSNFDAVVLPDTDGPDPTKYYNLHIVDQLNKYYGLKILNPNSQVLKHFDDTINSALRNHSTGDPNSPTSNVHSSIKSTLVYFGHILTVVVSSVIAFILFTTSKSENFNRIQMQTYTKIKIRLRSLLN